MANPFQRQTIKDRINKLLVPGPTENEAKKQRDIDEARKYEPEQASGAFGDAPGSTVEVFSRKKPYTDTQINRLINEIVLDVERGLDFFPEVTVGESRTRVEGLVEQYLMQPDSFFTPSAFSGAQGRLEIAVMNIVFDRNIEIRTFPDVITRGMKLERIVGALVDMQNTPTNADTGWTAALAQAVLRPNDPTTDKSLLKVAAESLAQIDIDEWMDLATGIRASLVPHHEQIPNPQVFGAAAREYIGGFTQEQISSGESPAPIAPAPYPEPDVAVGGHEALVQVAKIKATETFERSNAVSVANRVIRTVETRTQKNQFVVDGDGGAGLREWESYNEQRNALIEAILKVSDGHVQNMDLDLKAESIADAAEGAVVGFVERIQTGVADKETAKETERLQEFTDDDKKRRAELVRQIRNHGYDPSLIDENEKIALEEKIRNDDPITIQDIGDAMVNTLITKEETDSFKAITEDAAFLKSVKDEVTRASEGTVRYDELLPEDQRLVVNRVSENKPLRKGEVVGFLNRKRAQDQAKVEADAAKEVADAAKAAGLEADAATKAEALRIKAIDTANQAAITRNEIIFQTQTILGGSKEFREFLDEGGTIDDLVFRAQTALRNLEPGTDITDTVQDFIKNVLNDTTPGGVAGFEASFEDRLAREAESLDPSRVPGLPADVQRDLVAAGVTPFPTLSSAGTITQEELFGLDFGTDTELAQAALDISGGDPFLQEYLISQAGTKEFEERFRAEGQRRYQEAEDVFQTRFGEVVDTSTGKVTPAPEQTTARGPTHAGLSKTDFLAQESGALTSQFDVQPSTVQRRQNEEERARVQAETEAERDREDLERRALRGSFSTFSRSA